MVSFHVPTTPIACIPGALLIDLRRHRSGVYVVACGHRQSGTFCADERSAGNHAERIRGQCALPGTFERR
jgi:hypothetical protein